MMLWVHETSEIMLKEFLCSKETEKHCNNSILLCFNPLNKRLELMVLSIQVLMLQPTQDLTSATQDLMLQSTQDLRLQPTTDLMLQSTQDLMIQSAQYLILQSDQYSILQSTRLDPTVNPRLDISHPRLDATTNPR